MKQIRQWCIIWVGLFFIGGCGVFEENDSNVLTDQGIYAVPNNLNYNADRALTIKTSFRNTTGHVLYLPKCVSPPEPMLQHFENGAWVEIDTNHNRLLCYEPPIVILWNDIYEQNYYFHNNMLLQLIKQGRIQPNQENNAYRLVFSFVAKPSVLNPEREETYVTDTFYLVLDK